MQQLNNIARLKDLYGDEFDEKHLITVFDVNGNPFQMIGASYPEINALEGGYIITPDGKFITVRDFQEHDDVFSLYINYYKGTPESTEQWGSYECTKMLNDMKHIVYFGVKTRYTTEIVTGKEAQNYLKDARISNIAKGYGVLSFPKDRDITNEQKLATQLLLFTNDRQTGEKASKVLDISYGNMEENIVYDHRDMLNVFQPKEEAGLHLPKEDITYALGCFNRMVVTDMKKLNRVKSELQQYDEKTNMDVKVVLRDLYRHIESSDLSALEKGREFAEVIRIAQSYDDPTVYGYMMGEDEKLRIANEKLFFKLNRYQNWVEYIQKGKINQNQTAYKK